MPRMRGRCWAYADVCSRMLWRMLWRMLAYAGMRMARMRGRCWATSKLPRACIFSCLRAHVRAHPAYADGC
jgi:hypothetical protein